MALLRDSCSLRRSGGLFAMKLLVVTLALGIFTGSQASVLRDESISKMDKLGQEFGEYVNNLVMALSKKQDLVGESDIGQALGSWIEDRATKLEQHWKALKNAIPPEVKNVSHQASSALWDVWRKVINDWFTLHGKVLHEREAFYQALESDLNPALEKLDYYMQPLRQTLVKTVTELNEKLNELLKGQLETLQPHSEEIQRRSLRLQEGQDALEPIAGQVQKNLLLKVQKAYDFIKQSAASILEIIKKHREGFNQWVRDSPVS